MRRVAVLWLVMGAFAVAQDKKPDPEPKTVPPPKADVRGQVESVFAVKARGIVGTMLVKGVKEADTAYDQASVRVTTAAKVYRWKAGKKAAATFSDIKRGDRVQAVFTGPVAESYPVQATASEVLILETAKKAER